jgi:hypothetical protein
MPNMSISINYRRPLGLSGRFIQLEGLREAIRLLEGCASGRAECDGITWGYNDTAGPASNNAYAGRAAGLLVGATLTGAVGGTIGGTLVTVTAAGGDTVTQSALAAAIRANATVGLFVTATNKLSQLTVASVVAGATVVVWNQTFTAIANGATVRDAGQFSVGASDTACALNLATAINQHPSLASRVRAVSVVGAVFIGDTDDLATSISTAGIRSPSATTITVNVALPVAGVRTMVLAGTPGIIGNFVTVVASGTGMTYLTNGTAGQLGLGMGGVVPAFQQVVQP